MPGLRRTLADIAALRQKLEGLIPAAQAANGPTLPERTAFGANPGALRLRVHVPRRLVAAPPLVVALHGCGQTASEYAHGTGWTRLADRHGFVVVLPEQQAANNPKCCFSWFQPGDITRDLGEARSIHAMVEHAIAELGADRSRVFITGLSAGGAMASAMLASYPETYAGGAIIAGLPYGCASSVQQALEAMFSDQSPTVRGLGDRVRSASQHAGPWPTISVWHGTDDRIVKPSNAEHIVRQWADVHGLPVAPTHTGSLHGHTHRVWKDADGRTLIEAVSVAGMGHGVPIAPSANGIGEPGPFFLDVGLSSTELLARAWGLTEGLPATQPAAEGATIELSRTEDRPQEPAAPHQAHAGFNPANVIAEAFKAAGLPYPKHGSSSQVDPASLIDAVLKAARLRR